MAAMTAWLPGCGFSPVYSRAAGGAAGPAEANLAAITVGPMPERLGQELRQALQGRFDLAGTGVARRYDLSVSLALSGEPIAIQQDSSITRIRLLATASWTLSAQDPLRSTLSSGTARTLDGYNIINQQFFAADQQNEAVQLRMMEALSDQITLQIAGYFKRRAPAAA